MRSESVENIVRQYWQSYGRNFYSRHDYEGVDKEPANELMERLRSMVVNMKGKQYGNYEVEYSDDFSYTDPIDNID
ncbi:MAG: hypothetical protein AB4038_14785 [Prochloraceae cyanobacterium]